MYIICFLLLIILLSVQNSVIGLHWADLFSCSIKYSVNCYFYSLLCGHTQEFFSKWKENRPWFQVFGARNFIMHTFENPQNINIASVTQEYMYK